MTTEHDKVSFESERLILVDSDDNVVGYESKAKAHDGEGLLHRAFSIFLFDDTGRVLLQQRSRKKRLWPLYWSNTCCSHPREGESYDVATHRRLKEELAVDTELEFLYRFQYQALFDSKLGSEHELCSVYIGHLESKAPVNVNPHEIADWRWVPRGEVDRWIATKGHELTPWFKMEWERLQKEFATTIDRLTSAA